MALYVVLFFIGVGIIGSVVSAIAKARKEAKAKQKMKECAYKIVTMHNKYCPNDNITYNVIFDSIVNRFNTLIIYGSFEEFFTRNDPSKSGKWSDEDIEQFNNLMAVYRANKAVYKNQFNKQSNHAPIRTYSENTGNAKLDAINAQYNARVSQAIVNQAASTGMKKQKSAVSAMVKGAVVGKVIGGDAGAVVGAMVAKEKHDSENKK
jgi:hypothetical protein